MGADIFTERSLMPMLIGEEGEPFDSDDFLFELKLDGERCLAYSDGSGIDLRNKRNHLMLPKVPELSEIHRQIKGCCILDGELFVMKDGKTDFFEIQRRSLTTNRMKISLAAARYPANFAAFDILYRDGELLTDLPLTERKMILEETVAENDRIAVTRCIERHGKAFFDLAKEKELEGIVAKKKDSRYYFGQRTKDWIKIKYLKDDDFVVCGYIAKANGVASLVLGQYRDGKLADKGHVTLGVSGEDFEVIQRFPRASLPPFPDTGGNTGAVWIEPKLVCTVKYMMLQKSGSLRQPVFKGLRSDKPPEDCTDHAVELSAVH